MVGVLLIPLALLFPNYLKQHGQTLLTHYNRWDFGWILHNYFIFPFDFFSLIKLPDYFVMVYAIITGGHLFPYAWFYKTNLYAVFAGILTVGAMLCGLLLPIDKLFIIPMFMSVSLIILTVLLFFDSKKKQLQKWMNKT